MSAPYDHGLALEAASTAGRDFVTFAPGVLDRLLTTNDPDISSAFAKILRLQSDEIRTAMLKAGATEGEAEAVVATYRGEITKAQAERRRRASN